VGNHIYYARYLDLLEGARGEFVRSLGTSLQALQEQETIFPAVECRLKYKAPARYDDVLTIELWLTELRGARINFGYRVINQDERLILEAETWHVCTSLADKPKRLSPELTAKLHPFLRAATAVTA
jgi:acyl-CoA thioester hydrolase